jgi:hypothetical protein
MNMWVITNLQQLLQCLQCVARSLLGEPKLAGTVTRAKHAHSDAAAPAAIIYIHTMMFIIFIIIFTVIFTLVAQLPGCELCQPPTGKIIWKITATTAVKKFAAV